ncbi:hypothetical protein PQX77_007442 [Marasmius sp. AFHP31]|nr:hypothetical protein PQX77_007442 [Marasmius sp. AFHP31]
MTELTLAEWTCSLNGCRYPLEGTGLGRSFLCHRKTLPFSFTLAQSVLHETNTSLHPTDLSYHLRGDIGVTHIINSTPRATCPVLPRPALQLMRKAKMADLSKWWTPSPHDIPRLSFRESWVRKLGLEGPTAWIQDLKQWVQHTDLRSLVNHVFGVSDDGSHGPYADLWLLAIPRDARQRLAEDTLRGIAASSPRHPPDDPDLAQIHASDGSTIPAPASFSEPRSSSFSSLSHTHMILASLDAYGLSANNQTAEVYGILSSILSIPPESVNNISLYSDNSNAIRNIPHAKAFPSFRFSSNPTRSLYRWISSLLQKHNLNDRLSIHHIPSHTNSTTPPAKANDLADKLASSAHRLLIPPPPAPIPTFYMDNFTLFSSRHSYIESDPTAYISNILATKQANDRSFRPAQTLMLPLHDPTSPPAYPYTRALSAYSVTVQLYARSSQLDTKFTRFRRLGDVEPWCSFGCTELETDHHIFAECPQFSSIRNQTTNRLTSSTESMVQKPLYALGKTDQDELIQLASRLFVDSDVWPTHRTRYYLGTLPDLTRAVSRISQRTRTAIAQLWHTEAIRLAGRIWGDYKRSTRSKEDEVGGIFKQKPIKVPHFLQL